MTNATVSRAWNIALSAPCTCPHAAPCPRCHDAARRIARTLGVTPAGLVKAGL